MLNNIGRNIILFEELKKILGFFNSAKVEVMLLRGSFFITVNDLFFLTREMEDIDIAVRKRDFEKAVKIVKSQGYVLVKSGEWAFAKKGSLAALDIHKGFFGDDFFYEDEFWRCSKEISVSGFKARVLSPPHQIFYSVWHSAVHHICFKRKWMEDMARFEKIYGDGINWSEIVFLARRLRVEIPFYTFFKKQAAVSIGFVPHNVISELCPKTVSGKFLLFLYSLIAEKNRKISEIGHLSKFLFSGNFIAKLRFVANYFFPKRDFMERRYSFKNAPILYLVRPFLAFYKLSREITRISDERILKIL